MSYYPGQPGGGQYPTSDQYSIPASPRDPSYPSWDQQQQQESQQSQLSDNTHSQQVFEQPQLHQHFSSSQQQPLYHQNLEDPQHSVPSQISPVPRGIHDPTPVRLHPVAPHPGRSPPVEIQPVMLDTILRSTAHAGPSTQPRTHQHHYHPYRQSGDSGNTVAVHRREPDSRHQQVRFPTQTNVLQHPGSAMHSPAAGRQTFTSPMSEHGPLQGSSPSYGPTSPLAAPPEGVYATVPPVLPQAVPVSGPQYKIRSDTHYDPATQIWTALLELPGMKKSDLTIKLATTPFNRSRQITVNGESHPPLPATVPTHRERKYGRFMRAFPVPVDTKPEDIDAVMEDGVLILKISCGSPAASTDEHEIPIR